MRIRKLIIWLVSIAMLVMAGFVLLIKPNLNSSGSIEKMLSSDLSKSDEIILIGVSDTLQFTRVDSSWKDASGELLSKEQVENILFAADHMKMKSILGDSEISGCDYHVELSLLRKQKEIGSFNFASGNLGDFIYKEGSEKAYGIELPGFEDLPLKKVFSANLAHYHPHMLIDLLPSEIAYIEITPLRGPSFRLYQDLEYNVRVEVGDSDIDVSQDLNEHQLRMLLTYFNAITYTDILENVNLSPGYAIARISVRDIHENERTLEVFSWIPEGQTDIDIYSAAVRYEGKSVLLSVDYYYLDLLIRGLESYR